MGASFLKCTIRLGMPAGDTYAIQLVNGDKNKQMCSSMRLNTDILRVSVK